MIGKLFGFGFLLRIVGLGIFGSGLLVGAMQSCVPGQAMVTLDLPPVETGGPPAGVDVVVVDAFGADVIPSTFYPEGTSPTGDPFPAPMLALDAGCYFFQIEARSPGRPGVVVWFQSYTSSYQAELCVTESEQRTVRARRLVSSESGSPPLAVGTIVDADGSPVAGAGLDVFEPIATITEAELRALTLADHQAFDYRAAYLASEATDADGHYLYRWPSFAASCRVATLIAPAGYEFADTGSPFLNRTMCPDETPPPTLSVQLAGS